MKKSISVLLAIGIFSMATSASAVEPLFHPQPLRVGFGADLGVPSGGAVGIVAHPKLDWLAISLSATYNGIAPGGRLGLRIDPLALYPKVPIGVFAEFQGGLTTNGHIPGHSEDLPGLGYDYFNDYVGLRLGKATGFQWDFLIGPTYIYARTDNFQTVVPSGKNLVVNNPTVSGWIFPTFETGFQVVFP